MLIKSASSTELSGGVTNTLKGNNPIHSDLEQLENSNKLSGTDMSPGWFPHPSTKGTELDNPYGGRW